jgi:hypothetical protein
MYTSAALDAPPVVLLLGLGVNATLNWSNVLPTLSRSFPVVAPDLVHARDQLVPPALQFALARALPGALIHPVDGDHFAVVKRPETYVGTLMRALRDVYQRSCPVLETRRSA